MHTKGFSLIEVMIVICLLGVLAIGLGQSLVSVEKIKVTSQKTALALSLAEEWLEIMTAEQNYLFACHCASHHCSATTCTRPSDNQSCTLLPDYESCWTIYPAGLVDATDFYLSPDEDGFILKKLATDGQPIAGQPDFFRKIIITNALRDSNGYITTTGTPDPHTKKITVQVWYLDRGNNRHETNLATILTAWKKL
ncbi:MAG TPA: prepilin-type N-terminal cleavage/methylation domain-containing protein [Patescibacteria group bacterium]|nr:prepilin-type N-terminal cleavage/methylation domain-containing protein [Patescibacteria group bacterium]